MSYYNIFDEYGLKHFQVPKVFFTSEKYKKMTNDERMAWAILKDRFSISVKNGWYDDTGEIYFVFSNDELMDILGCRKEKLAKIKKKLVELDLLEQKRQGLGKTNKLYLKKPVVSKSDMYEIDKSEGNRKNFSTSSPSTEVRKSNVKKFENRTPEVRKSNSRSSKIERQEVRKSNSSNTNLSNINLSNTNNNHHHLMKVGFTKKQAEMINRFQLENKLNDDDDDFHLLVNKLMKYKPHSMSYIAKVFETIKHEGHYTLNKNDEVVPEWLNDRSKSKNVDLKNDDFDIDKLKEEMIDFVNEHKKDE